MSFVPYTRDAVRRIRAGASARALGWDAEMYRSVCRKHGITAHCDIEAVQAVCPIVPIAPPVSARRTEPILEDLPPLSATFDHATGAVEHCGRVIKLRGPMQRNILRALLDARAESNEFAHGEWIAARAGTGYDSLSVIIGDLRGHLRRVGLVIEGRRSHAGGYRLRAAP